MIKSLENKIKNFIFLDNEIYEINTNFKKVIFIGTTLWSYIPDHCKKIIKNLSKDYQCINMAKDIYINFKLEKFIRRLNVEDTQILHSNAKSFIKYFINYFKYEKDAKVILLTHHKPIWEANNKYNPYTNYFFQSDIGINLINSVSVIIHGSIQSPNKKIKNTRIVNNLHGNTDKCLNFHEDAIVEINLK